MQNLSGQASRRRRVGNLLTPVAVVFGLLPCDAFAADALSKSLVFYASFDHHADATRSTGDGAIRTAETFSRESVRKGNHRQDASIVENAGRFGGALRFTEPSKQLLFYDGVNFAYQQTDWSGTVSFWLKLDPDRDLKPGFCDPIQITDKKWNDAAMWVDFDKELPRDCRLGMFPNYKSWNPNDTPYDQVPSNLRPWVPVKKPPFSRDRWTHVAWTFDRINAKDGSDATVVFYLNGRAQGTLQRPLRFDWEPENVAIMIGINYIGDFDDLAVFDRPLDASEIHLVGEAPPLQGGNRAGE